MTASGRASANARIGPPDRPGRVHRLLRSGTLYLVLYAGAVVMLLPFIWMFAGSFRPEQEFLRTPEQLLPTHPTVQAYLDIWTEIPFARLYLNSVVFASVVAGLSLFLDSLAAFALARLSFRGRRVAFWVVLIVLMVPFQITLIPLYVTVVQLGWLNTFLGLIVPRATNAFGIFLLRQFFISIPRELDEAARIDGASEWRIYRSIILPLSKPALATLFIFHFMFNWNDFLWPLTVTTSMDMRTLPAGLALLMGQHSTQHSLLLAGATLALLPLLVGFLFAQRHFVRGIAMTGLK